MKINEFENLKIKHIKELWDTILFITIDDTVFQLHDPLIVNGDWVGVHSINEMKIYQDSQTFTIYLYGDDKVVHISADIDEEFVEVI